MSITRHFNLNTQLVQEKVVPQASKETSTKLKSTKTTNFRKPKITVEQRAQMIAEAAYYLGEKRGFTGDDSQYDWFEAENKIDRLLS